MFFPSPSFTSTMLQCKGKFSTFFLETFRYSWSPCSFSAGLQLSYFIGLSLTYSCLSASVLLESTWDEQELLPELWGHQPPLSPSSQLQESLGLAVLILLWVHTGTFESLHSRYRTLGTRSIISGVLPRHLPSQMLLYCSLSTPLSPCQT